MDKYEVALAGRGAREIYQIGAWKALEELGVKYEAVTGTSTKAISGAFIVQGYLRKAIDM